MPAQAAPGIPGVLRSQIARLVRWALAREGIVLVHPELTYGFDVWSDILRLSKTWKYPIDLFFDVGANDGETAVGALRRFPQARVIGFEPSPPTFAALTAKLGNEARFKAVNCALGVEIGEVAMLQYDLSKINSLVPDAPFAVRFGKEGRRIGVQCTTLDAYCAQHRIERIDVLKIDTEGFDFVVLQGSETMLRKQAIKFVYVEFNDLQPREGAFGGALLPIDSLLRPHGYRFIASYTDYIVTEGEMFSVSNALFALPPSALARQAVVPTAPRADGIGTR